MVYPAAMFAPQVSARGVPVAEFNMETTPATSRFRYRLPGGETGGSQQVWTWSSTQALPTVLIKKKKKTDFVFSYLSVVAFIEEQNSINCGLRWLCLFSGALVFSHFESSSLILQTFVFFVFLSQI